MGTDTAGSVLDSPARSRLIERVRVALATVRDPELDEDIVSLRFVASTTISGDGDVIVHLRLPTYFCAPNFAFLMVADAFDAVSAVADVRSVVVELDDHFASETINAGVAARAGFAASFGELAAGELDELRVDFLRRAVLAGTDHVCRPLTAQGSTPVELAGMRFRDLPPSAELHRLRGRRADIGLPADDDAFLLVDVETGEPVKADDLRLHLGRARLSRVNIEANGSMCRGMLASRYGMPAPDDESSIPTALRR